MAANGTGSKKSHKDRKNMNANDLFKKQKHAKNAARPKQVYMGQENGMALWLREAA